MKDRFRSVRQAASQGIHLETETRDQSLARHLEIMEVLENRHRDALDQLRNGVRSGEGGASEALKVMGDTWEEKIKQMTGGLKRNRDLVIFGKTFHLPPLQSN